MSNQPPVRRLTSKAIRERKGGEPMVMLTAYSAPLARLADSHCDILLVGDSLGMVVHGLESTVPVTLDMMILHGRAVVRGSAKALVVVDMPFGSIEESPAQAFRNAARVMQETGAGAVKIEGGVHTAATVRFLVERGIPVMGHIGLTPQSINTLGSYKAHGRIEAQWAPIEADARAVTEAGAFAMVLEAMAEPLAAKITRSIPVPTIGIGASAACDGQVLVVDDMLGITPAVPKFVKRYGDAGRAIEDAIVAYAKDVRQRSFPGAEHTYEMQPARKT